MRSVLTILIAFAALPMLAARTAQARYAAQLYPYCSLGSSSGATNCCISSREQCGRGACIGNPWSIGRERAHPYLERLKSIEPHYVEP